MSWCKRPNCRRREHAEHCGLCSAHFKQKQKERIARGDWLPGRVPAGPAIEHLDNLLASGWTQIRLTARTGLSHGFFSHLRHKQTIRADTEAKILAVSTHDAGRLEHGGRCVPVLGTQRRLRALRAMGYSIERLARESGLNCSNLKHICSGHQPSVFIETAHAVADTFKRLEMTPPPPSRGTSRAVNRARKLGWAPPFAWDEDEIDDPAARPRMRGVMPGDWYREYLRFKGLGLNDGQAAKRMGISAGTLSRRLSRR